MEAFLEKLFGEDLAYERERHNWRDIDPMEEIYKIIAQAEAQIAVEAEAVKNKEAREAREPQPGKLKIMNRRATDYKILKPDTEGLFGINGGFIIEYIEDKDTLEGLGYNKGEIKVAPLGVLIDVASFSEVNLGYDEICAIKKKMEELQNKKQ